MVVELIWLHGIGRLGLMNGAICGAVNAVWWAQLKSTSTIFLLSAVITFPFVSPPSLFKFGG